MEQGGGDNGVIAIHYLPDGGIIFNGTVYEPPEPGAQDVYRKNNVLDRVNAMTDAERHSMFSDPPLVFRKMFECAAKEEETPDWFRQYPSLVPKDGPEPYQVRLATAKSKFYREYRENYQKYIEKKTKGKGHFIEAPIVAAASCVNNKLTPVFAAGNFAKHKLTKAYGVLKNATKTEWGIGLGIGLTAGAAFSYFLLKK